MDLRANFCEGLPGGRGSAVRDPEIRFSDMGYKTRVILMRTLPTRTAAIVIGIHRRPPFPSAPPCPRSFSRAPKRTQRVRSIDRKRRWRRKRRRDPWHSAVEGTVDPGGLDVPAPPRVKVGDFAFYPFAFVSDKRAVIADERAVFRGNDT